MKIRKAQIMLALILAAANLTGCGGKTEAAIESNAYEIVGVKDSGEKEQGKEAVVTWVKLGELTTYDKLRTAIDNEFETKVKDGVKSGILFTTKNSNSEQNNTLLNVLSSKTAAEKIQQMKSFTENNSDIFSDSFADKIADSDAIPASLNAYFNLLADNEPNYFNGGASLTRAEAMALVMRATTPVESTGKPTPNKAFTEAVGEGRYVDYASYLDSKSYISTSDQSLNKSTIASNMSRVEYVYLVMGVVFGGDSINSATASMEDCVEATSIKGATHAEVLKECLKNPDAGLPTELYKPIAKAVELGIIPSTTKWDEAITKAEAINIFMDTVIAYNEVNGYPDLQ